MRAGSPSTRYRQPCVPGPPRLLVHAVSGPQDRKQLVVLGVSAQVRTLSLVNESPLLSQPTVLDLGHQRDLSPASGRPGGAQRNRARIARPQLHGEGSGPDVSGRAHVAYADRRRRSDLRRRLHLDPAPLGFERPAGENGRLLLPLRAARCALLRATGTPARVRSGFAGYFEARRWIDHWVVSTGTATAGLTDPQTGRRDLTSDDFQDGPAREINVRRASLPALHRNGGLWGWDELRGSLINNIAALNKVEVSGWNWCDHLEVKPLDQPHGELDSSLDVLSRLAATAESVETIKECFDLYPELQPPREPSRDRPLAQSEIVRAPLMHGPALRAPGCT